MELRILKPATTAAAVAAAVAEYNHMTLTQGTGRMTVGTMTLVYDGKGTLVIQNSASSAAFVTIETLHPAKITVDPLNVPYVDVGKAAAAEKKAATAKPRSKKTPAASSPEGEPPTKKSKSAPVHDAKDARVLT